LPSLPASMRTLGELDIALDYDLAWRRTEMHSLLSSVRTANGPAGDCLRRAGITLMYAHWEGYTKNALLNYWKYVARRGLSYKDLNYNFVALGIERELARAQGAGATEKMIVRVQRIMGCDDDRALMNERDIDTQSNLNSDVLSDLFQKLGLDASSLETKFHFIDFSLLANRNSIAHGEYLPLSVTDYSEAHGEVLDLLNAVRNIISNAASTRQYRRDFIGASTSV
jgi:hypothetical protein